MGGKSSNAPDYPSPGKITSAQAAANEATARTQSKLNNVNQYTPYGQLVYTDLGNDRWRSDLILPPDAEAAAARGMQISRGAADLGYDQLGRIRSNLSTPFSYDGIANDPRQFNGEADRQRVEDALYGRASSRLDPQWGQRETGLITDLENQGITRGSSAWDQAMSNFGRDRNDAYASARQDAINAGGAEQSRLFGLDQSARQSAIQERIQQREMPVNELSALMSNSQVQTPQFSAPPATSVAPTDVIGAYNARYNAQANQYAAGQSNQNALMGGLFGLGGAALGGYLSR